MNEREAPTDASAPSWGTMSYMPPIMGQMLAGCVIRALLGMRRKGLLRQAPGKLNASIHLAEVP